MNFTFTEEQLLIRDMAERFFRDEYDLDTRRKHQAMPGGFCPETWAQFAEMGWLALGIPEDLGGVGGGSVETAILMEAMGGGLAVEPFLSTVVLGGGLMIRGGSPEQQGDLLPKLAAAGWEGPIFATEATCDLLDFMLRDTARIQEADFDLHETASFDEMGELGASDSEPRRGSSDDGASVELLTWEADPPPPSSWDDPADDSEYEPALFNYG